MFLKIICDPEIGYSLVVTSSIGMIGDETIFSTYRSRILCIPVVKGEVFKVDDCTDTSGVYMRLYPSLGNVVK